ncbi:uncharacterized protein LOC134692732 [Mytilus trossulus]|uniref:uncharacterized protein LOC134692732 n=1 Tax=Mytilus trossulus TaxID=6551 RepID=UPI0030054D92
MTEETQDRNNGDEWTPPDDMVPDNQFTSSWKSAWKQIIIKVTLENGKEIGTADATGTLMPVKMQFLMTHHRDRLEPVIKAISSLQISKINFAEEFLEVKVKSEPPLAVISEIVNCLTNEFDEVILKTVPKLPFTLQMAEEVLQEQLAAKSIDLVEDNTAMFIIGFYDSKSLINKLIEQITSSSVKKAVSLDEKWKTMALKRFGLLEQLSQKFYDVNIGLQEEQNCVYFQGQDIKVQEAIHAMNKCLSSLLMKKIQFDPLVIQLLTCSEASLLFCEILEKENIQLVWKVDKSGAEGLQFYCNQDINVCIVKSAIYENFLSTGLSTSDEGCENANAFHKSQIFTDIIAKNRNKLLVCKYTDKGILIASTKEIIKDLFHQERLFRKKTCISKSIQVDTIGEEVSKLKSQKAELETHIQHLEMKLKLVGKDVVATNTTAENQEQILHIDTSQQIARDTHATFMNKDSKVKTETKMGDIAAQVAMPKAKKLSDSFIQSTNCQSFITKEEIVIRVYVGSILKLNVEGIFGVPKEICRQMYCQAVISYSKKQGKLTSLKEIHFIDKDQDMIAMVQQEFSKHLTCIQQKPSAEPVGQTPKTKESTFNKQYMTRVGFKVQILQGDITKLRVDAIVCPQDEQCQSRGMIARAIENVNDNVYKRDVTGMKMIQKCEVRLCKASPKTLPFTYVLHTVPPRFDKNSAKDSSKFNRELQITLQNIVKLSNDRQDISTVAVPVLGIGTDGLETPYAIFSSVLAAEIMKATQSSWLNFQEIIIVTSEWGMAYAIAEQLDKEQGLTQVTSFQRSRRRQNKE